MIQNHPHLTTYGIASPILNSGSGIAKPCGIALSQEGVIKQSNKLDPKFQRNDRN